jgi:hypothetical protein
MNENERFTRALDFLLGNNILHYAKDMADMLSVNKDRIKYLRKENGGTLTSEEMQLLKTNYPVINWLWVKMGDGSMLTEDEPITLVAERALIYGKKPDLDQVLSEIITGSSILPVADQLKIARNEIVRLQQKIIALIKL